MAVLQTKCPHCYSMSQLRVIGFSAFPFGTPDHMLLSLGTACPGCHKPVAVLAKTKQEMGNLHQYTLTLQGFSQPAGSIVSAPVPIDTLGLSVVDIWPKAVEPSVPDHVPEAVSKAFLQAERNFPIVGHEEAAGSMYRRSLEVRLSIKYPDLKGTLAERIKKLVTTNVLTKELGKWAEGIRLVGNEAAHSDEVSREDLIMARAFTDAVLRYTFTLPEQVRLRAKANNG